MSKSSPIVLDQDYINNTLKVNFRKVIVQTEHSGVSSQGYLYTNFTWAVAGASTYSFGLYQFDIGSQDASDQGGHVKNFLLQCGFSQEQITNLESHGGIGGNGSATVADYSSQLEQALQVQSNIDAYNALDDWRVDPDPNNSGMHEAALATTGTVFSGGLWSMSRLTQRLTTSGGWFFRYV